MLQNFLSYWRRRIGSGFWLVLWLACLWSQPTFGQLHQNPQFPVTPPQRHGFNESGGGGAHLRTATEHDPIKISGEIFQEQTPLAVNVSGNSSEHADRRTRVFVLRGDCVVQQGGQSLSARQMVVWHTRTERNDRMLDRLLVYAEDDIIKRPDAAAPLKPPVFVELITSVGIETNFRRSDRQYVAQTPDPLHRRAFDSRQQIRLTAWNPPPAEPQRISQTDAQPLLPARTAPPVDFDSLAPLAVSRPVRRVVISPRSFGVGFNASSFLSEQTSPAEQITTISQGVNIVIEGIGAVKLSDDQEFDPGTLDMSADRAVIWTQADASGNFDMNMLLDENAPLQIYLEGNIEIRQGSNVLRAEKAYYDIKENRATFQDSELRVQIPEMEGMLKIRAQTIRQLSQQSYHAEDAWVTGSEFGVPTYRMETGDLFIEERFDDQRWLGRGDPQLDPQTGLPQRTKNWWVTSLNNRFRVGETPVFASPYLTGPASDPHVPLESVSMGADNIFGAQLRMDWNLNKILGIEAPGFDWNLQTDGFSERGFWLGTDGIYGNGVPSGIAGSTFGEFDAGWINDFGEDNLGFDRRSLDVPDNTRGRLMARHRQYINSDLYWTGEIGLLSDRNFLEQWEENEWDTGKDNETRLDLNYQNDNQAASVMGSVRLNDFSYETQWLPKADYTVLGEPILWDWLSYSGRSSIGYGSIRPAEAPDNPDDLFVPLNYMPEAEGAVMSTRHELSLPFNVGPMKLNPYILGEAAYWQDDGFTDSNLSRLYGSAGIRGSLMLWKAFPHIQNQILGLNGLAHKQTLGFDYSFSDSTEELSDVPQYNEFDENAQERFRTRYIFNTFGLNNFGALPEQFNPRNYAVRSGAARNVSSPYFELVDSQQVLRLEWDHRLQTKVGPPENQRVKDWMTLNLGMSVFPNAADDNFDETIGLLTAAYTWDVGARTKLLANGQFDFFENAPQVWDVGMLSQRSERGSVYLGYRNFQAGPLQSQLLTGSFSYAMSEKWIATAGTAYDIGENQDRGQSLTLTAIRPDFLIHVGASVDASKGNFGIGFMIEPRFGPLNGSANNLDSLLRAP